MSDKTTPDPQDAVTEEIPQQESGATAPAGAAPAAEAPAAIAPATAQTPHHHPMHWSAGLIVAVVIAAVVLLGGTFATGFVAGRVSAGFGGGRSFMMQRGPFGNQFRRGPMMGAPWGNRGQGGSGGYGGPSMGWRFRVQPQAPGQSQTPVQPQTPGTASPTPGRQ